MKRSRNKRVTSHQTMIIYKRIFVMSKCWPCLQIVKNVSYLLPPKQYGHIYAKQHYRLGLLHINHPVCSIQILFSSSSRRKLSEEQLSNFQEIHPLSLICKSLHKVKQGHVLVPMLRVSIQFEKDYSTYVIITLLRNIFTRDSFNKLKV